MPLALPCAATASSAEAAPAAARPSLSDGCHQALQRRKALNPREEPKTRAPHPRCEALVRASDQKAAIEGVLSCFVIVPAVATAKISRIFSRWVLGWTISHEARFRSGR